MDWHAVEVHKHPQKDRGQYPAILAYQAGSMKDTRHHLLLDTMGSLEWSRYPYLLPTELTA